MCLLGISVKQEVVKLAKNSGFHRKYIKKKHLPLRVLGWLGPARVSQMLPCFARAGSFFKTTDPTGWKYNIFFSPQQTNWLRAIAIPHSVRLSVRLSVCPSVRLSVC